MGRMKVRCLDGFWSAKAEFLIISSARPVASGIPTGFVSLHEAEQLLAANITAAKKRARHALELHPTDNHARYLLGAALRREGQFEEARAILEPLTENQPHIGGGWRELGLTLERLGETEKAIRALTRGIDSDPVDKDAWYALGNVLGFPRAGHGTAGSPQVTSDARLRQAGAALQSCSGEAEAILRQFPEVEPNSARALKRLADALILGDRWPEAKALLEKSLELVPDFEEARFRHATMLTAHREYWTAIPHIESLLRSHPENLLYRYLLAIALGGSRQYEPAMAEYEKLMEELPDRPGVWLQFAELARARRPQDCAGAFDRILRRFPMLVQATYLLATVKSLRLDESWIERILAQLDQPDLDVELRAQIHFVLGKAFEDLRRYRESFEHYRKSNDILQQIREPDIAGAINFKWLATSVFTPGFFRARRNVGCQDAGAIFIVGLPRSGSTLVEQILSSHSCVEGLGELQEMPDLIRERLGPDAGAYPHFLKTLAPEKFRELGEEYMARTRARRKHGRPYFTDKLPINYANVALIHLMLPNARIIDVRRHPLDCGFSCYKHYFPAGQFRALGRGTMARWYVDYVELMAHYDGVLPRKVHRLIYERLVGDPETEVRSLLDALGLPFEEQCLRFHETQRVVRTISAEQVRMPLYNSSVAHWRHYEPWLGPMKKELGYVLELYPETPKFYPRLKARAQSYPFGRINDVKLVKGIRQIPFEQAPVT
jgi:tetratricopeptide (TPR) repeat protein